MNNETDPIDLEEEQDPGETPPETLAVSPPAPKTLKRRKIYKEDEFSQCLKVRVAGDEDELISVPLDGQQNNNASMVVAAKLRNLYVKAVDSYTKSRQTMTPKELKDVMDAGKALIEITAMPYTGAPVGPLPSGSSNNTMGGVLAGMAAGMGVMAGMAQGEKKLSDVLEQMEKISKKGGSNKTPMKVVESEIAQEQKTA